MNRRSGRWRSTCSALLGYKAVVVTNGDAAVQRYKRALQKGRRFDAVILDLVVPDGMGGKEAMERLGGHRPTT